MINTASKDDISDNTSITTIFKIPVFVLTAYTLITALLFMFLYEHGLNRMVNSWFEQEEYSHGLLIPVISLFLMWQKKDILEKIEFKGSSAGIFLVLFGVFLIFLGEVSAITIFIQYGFVVTISGLALSYMGLAAFKQIAVPFALLFFMIPLPAVIFQGLSQYLQLISTQIGVFVIRLFEISVYVEGNVIDLGVYKLQVVDACSGLRYLFPLMTLGFIAAYFYKVANWKRVVVFLSSIPITIFMNSFRIGVIGITVEYWGIEMAEGFLHDFEGWIIFMTCTGLLVIEMWLLVHFGKENKPLLEVFGLELPAESPKDATVNIRPLPKQMIIAIMIIIVSIIASYLSPEKKDLIVERGQFDVFPKIIGEWNSSKNPRQFLESSIIGALKFDDYILRAYTNNQRNMVNLYIAYYASQSKGASIHSPRACLPAGGWQVREFADAYVNGVEITDGGTLRVNRVLIQMGEEKQLVYYWFPQRGRNITNEYLLKWYVFWDSLTMNRSDGALIRVTTRLGAGESISSADERIINFINTIDPVLDKYIPVTIK
ncbi:MAG: VPLPA-CTERM-specific exosortase XrtD [Pseudomonadota bacterium]